MAACTVENKGKYNPGPEAEEQSDEGRYRGIGLNMGAISEADFERLGSWGVNHGRWAFENWIDDLSTQTPAQYLDWISAQCDTLEARLPALEAYGITVNITIAHPPRGRDGDNRMSLFTDPELQTAFVDGWKIIAERFKNDTIVVYYDLLNEPNNDAAPYPNCINWRNLAIETANAIRAIDNTKKLVFEPSEDNNYATYTGESAKPLPGNDWVYSIHMYTPHVLTHQGVTSPRGVSYPGNITVGEVFNWTEAPEYWDRNTLRRFLDEICGVIGFARENNVEIYVGEFGCARWSPNHSAYNYIRDCLELFEEQGWHWAYFADGPYATENYAANTWSAQYNETYNSRSPAREPTDRLLMLQQYWKRNKK
jgi:hypothetical protein